MNYVELKEIINKLYGDIIIIGKFNDQLEKLIDENKKINSCDHLTNEQASKGNKYHKTKIINIRKIRKKYKNKRHNFMLINVDDVIRYKKIFVKDSIYITKEEIYLFGKKEEINNIMEKYSRYTDKIERKHFKDGYLLKVNSNIHISKIKNFYYYLYDTIIDIIDFISEILIS